MRNPVKIVLVCTCLLLAHISKATHILSIDGSATCVMKTDSSLDLELNFTQLRDGVSSSVPFDTEIEVGVYDRGTFALRKIVRLAKTGEASFGPKYFSTDFRVAHYTGTSNLPKNQDGYFILYGRCCMRLSENLPNDMSSAVVIEVLPNMNIGETTLQRDNFGNFFIQKNQQKTFDFDWHSARYDSVHFATNTYFFFGGADDPVPQLPATYSQFKAGSFSNSGAPGDPFGINGNFSHLNDSQFSIEITKLGMYFYPITRTAYLHGDSAVSTRMLPLFVVDTIPPLLELALTRQINGVAQFHAYSQDWGFKGEVDLQRCEAKPPYAFVSVQTNIGDGYAIPLTDGSLQQGVKYAYRLMRHGIGNTIYSDTVFVQSNLGGQDLNLTSIIQLYPNPANHQLTIEGSPIGQYQLLDLQGKILLEGIKSNELETLSIQSLKPGLYFLKIAGSTYRVAKSN